MHLPGQHLIIFNAENPDQALAQVQREPRTMLTAYFKANKAYPNAKDYLYQDFPSHFSYNKSTKEWTPRRRGFAIGRMYFASPNSGERFYLRMLLTVVRGATSFQDL